jgi:hypothetical protein
LTKFLWGLLPPDPHINKKKGKEMGLERRGAGTGGKGTLKGAKFA